MNATILALVLTITTIMSTHARDTVVLLHGLARTTHSMKKMESALDAEGFRVLNLSYPSRKHSIEDLATMVRRKITGETKRGERIHFVAHSLGAIIIRHIQSVQPIANIGRVVMLSPPNQGSEVVDKLGCLPVFKWLNGPAGTQLGTSPDGFVSKLKPINFEVAVITGDRSINWILSCMISGKDDGKVSTASARLDGMKAFKIVHSSHPFIMKNRKVISDVATFLGTGSFPAD